jgi:hypothetical protein
MVKGCSNFDRLTGSRSTYSLNHGSDSFKGQLTSIIWTLMHLLEIHVEFSTCV